MIKRPLNPQFNTAVLEGRKFTTIREKPWPVGVPIMLYNWSGAAYRSPQVNVAAVIVEETGIVHITHREGGGIIYFGFIHQNFHRAEGTNLYKSEGFSSAAEMADWFRPLIKPGQTVEKHLMKFRLA
jgi:hypothetical protein